MTSPSRCFRSSSPSIPIAVVAVILAVVGLYGVLSTVVRQRTAEIGVRMAFGATRGNILRLVVGEGLRLSAVGVGPKAEATYPRASG